MDRNQTAVMQRAVANAQGVARMNARGLGDIVRDSFFIYATNAFTFTAGNENFQQAMAIQADAHFLCVATTYTNTAEVGNMAAGTATPYVRVNNGGALVQITDGGNQRFLSNVPVPVRSLFGTGELPHIWEFTHLFRANTPINVSITGMAAAAPFAGQVIRLMFHGFKVPVNSLTALGL